MNEEQPKVEFAEQTEEESTPTPGWLGFGAAALVTGAAMIFFGQPGAWQHEVVDHNTGRRQWIPALLEAIGFVPTMTILGTICAASLIAGVISFVKWLRTRQD